MHEEIAVENAALSRDKHIEESVIVKPPTIGPETAETITGVSEHLLTTMPQLPPRPVPVGRCSTKLQEKIRFLLELKHRKNLDFNTSIQKRKSFKDPGMYKILLSFLNLDEYGSNFSKGLFDPTGWREESFYDNLSKAQKEAYKEKEREKAKQARARIEFVSGTKTAAKRPARGERPKKRKRRWDVGPAPAVVKTAAPQPKVGFLSASDVTSAAKKLKRWH